jgi:hypothetical protein
LQFSDVELLAIIPNKIKHQMAKKIVESFLKGRILVKIKINKNLMSMFLVEFSLFFNVKKAYDFGSYKGFCENSPNSPDFKNIYILQLIPASHILCA